MKREKVTHGGNSMKARKQGGCAITSRENTGRRTQTNNATKEESVV